MNERIIQCEHQDYVVTLHPVALVAWSDESRMWKWKVYKYSKAEKKGEHTHFHGARDAAADALRTYEEENQ